MLMDRDARGSSPPCAELPADVLREIAGRLHDPDDFVRFRAVCRPWREAPPPSRTPSFLPWLVETFPLAGAPGLLVRSPLSARKTRHLLPLSALRGMEIEGSDTSSGRVLGVGDSDEGRTVALINPLDGDAVPLPLVPQSRSCSLQKDDDKWLSAGVVVCRNGAVVFHTVPDCELAAIQLRPGGRNWEEVNVACPKSKTWWMCTEKRRATAVWSSVVPRGVACGVVTMPVMPHAYDRRVLEFRGELLFVDMHMPERYTPGSTSPNPMSVQIHKMQAQDDGWHRWVEVECTDHICFFFSRKCSFAIDAREYAGSVIGRCVYFTFWPESEASRGVYRYCFRSGTATLIDKLPTSFGVPMWFVPRPRVSA